MRALVARGIACAVLAAGCLVGVGAPAGAAGCADDIGTRQAVILVHGFNSGPGTWTEGVNPMIDAVQAVEGIYSRLFDYQNHNTQWVTHDAIGPALADFIGCVSESSFAAGGPGMVVLVAHSMGGLAARCALDASCSGRSDIADRVDLVLTLGTPNLGSFLRGGGVSDPLTAVGVTFGAACDVGNLISVGGVQGLCDFIDALGTSPAGRAFAPGSSELAALPPLPPEVQVHAVAGEVDWIQGVFFWVSETSVGDLVVGTDSALSEATAGSRTVDCGVLFLGSTQPPSCSHLTETTDNDFQREVVTALREYTATITYSIVFGGYGSVRQGDTEADVRSVAAPGAGEDDFNYCHLIGVPDAYDGRYTTGYLIDRRSDSVLGVDPPATAITATGLRVGATADQVLEAYRGDEFEWVFGVEGTTWILLVNAPGDRESAIGFAFDWPPTATPPLGNAVSSRISAGNRDFASGFELCSG